MTGEIICLDCKKGMSLEYWIFIHGWFNRKHQGKQVNTSCSRMMPLTKENCKIQDR